MADNLTQVHYDDLSACDPEDVVKRTSALWDADSRQYEIAVWGHDYIVAPDRCRISPRSSGGSSYQDYLYLFIVYYLMHGQDVPPSGDWVSEKDIRGGEGFFRGPHLIPVQRIAETVDNDRVLFAKICKQLKGTPLDFADAAFCFEITPAIPVALLFWEGDEDFPCEIKMLLDRTIERHLSLDIIFALAVEVCATVINAVKRD
jgi:hypothetical protein